MANLKLPKALVRELADTTAPCHALIDAAPIEAVIENRQYDMNRWSSLHELVLKDNRGKLWVAHYSQGLTEYQDEAPFESEGPEVTFVEVRAIPVVSYTYEEV